MPIHRDDYDRPVPPGWTQGEESAWQAYNGRRILFGLRHTPRLLWRESRDSGQMPFPVGTPRRSDQVELAAAHEETLPPDLRNLRQVREAELAAMAEEAEFRSRRANYSQQIAQAAYLEHQVGVPKIDVAPYHGMRAPAGPPEIHALPPAALPGLPDVTSEERKQRLLDEGYEEEGEYEDDYEYDD